MTGPDTRMIDDRSRPDLALTVGTTWRPVTDRVMGGVTAMTVTLEPDGTRCWLRLRGRVRLENDGGFLQIAADLAPGGATLDASAFTALRLTVRGNGETYGVHLRTPACQRPWQSYRASFTAPHDAATLDLPLASFLPHRLEAPLDTSHLRRIGLVAIGRAFDADLAIGGIALVL